jgi:hypothetical protein
MLIELFLNKIDDHDKVFLGKSAKKKGTLWKARKIPLISQRLDIGAIGQYLAERCVYDK